MKNLLRAAAALTMVVFALASCAGGADASKKVLNRSVIAKLKSFDPANLTDLYTSTVAGDAMETLYEYKYLADQFELEPLLAEGQPTVSADGLTYTIKIRKDAFYYDGTKTVFKEGKGRAVKASDFVYSIKRLADPTVESGGWWLFDGYLKGLNEWAKAAKDAKKADYAAEIEGVKALDDNTLQLTLTKPYPQILYTLSMSFTFPTPPEWVASGEDWANTIIGTGPYYLDPEQTIPQSKYVFTKNPTWHGQKYPVAAEIGSKAKAMGLEKAAGQSLPFVNTVVYNIIEEDNPRWLKLMSGEIDLSTIPKDNFKDAIGTDGGLTGDPKSKGLSLEKVPRQEVTYYFFNMEDPILGAPAGEKGKKVRQAMSLAWSTEKYIEVFDNGRAKPMHTVIPEGFGGYDPNYKNPYKAYDMTKAKALLAEAGYPNGKGLPVIKYEHSGSSALDRQTGEFFAKYMAEIGVKIEDVYNDWPGFMKKTDKHLAQMGGLAWGADYPDAQDFLQLLYSKNAAPGPNTANYSNPEFDKLYEQASVMLPGPERDALYQKAALIAVEDCPWIVERARIYYSLTQNWVKNYHYLEIGQGYSKYVDIDLGAKDKALTGKK
jgi:ABC-type transport system substrate-binding protein